MMADKIRRKKIPKSVRMGKRDMVGKSVTGDFLTLVHLNSKFEGVLVYKKTKLRIFVSEREEFFIEKTPATKDKPFDWEVEVEPADGAESIEDAIEIAEERYENLKAPYGEDY